MQGRPAIHKALVSSSHTRMRRKFFSLASLRPCRAQSMNSVRPSCMALKATANTRPRSPNARGRAADSTRPKAIKANSSSRTGRRSGSSQLVTHPV